MFGHVQLNKEKKRNGVKFKTGNYFFYIIFIFVFQSKMCGMSLKGLLNVTTAFVVVFVIFDLLRIALNVLAKVSFQIFYRYCKNNTPNLRNQIYL